MNKKIRNILLLTSAFAAFSCAVRADDDATTETKSSTGVTIKSGKHSGPRDAVVAQSGRRVTKDVFLGQNGNFLFNQDRPRSRSLVVRNSEDKDANPIKEDLAIMSRIIEKGIADELSQDTIKASGIPVFLHDMRTVRNFYIEDYGALFLLNVNMALTAPEPAKQKKDKGGDAPDSTWEQTRNELLGRKRTAVAGYKERHSKAKEFDQDEVDRLQNALIEALRNASNMHLKPEDWVTIAVSGAGGGEEEGEMSITQSSDGAARVWSFQSGQPGHPMAFEDSPDAETATMVLRVKKGDIDKFGKDKSGDEFKKKVSITVY
jgi:hypothetical protein